MCVEMHWILNFIKTYNMKILQVAFLLLFNYLDSLPKLYHQEILYFFKPVFISILFTFNYRDYTNHTNYYTPGIIWGSILNVYYTPGIIWGSVLIVCYTPGIIWGNMLIV